MPSNVPTGPDRQPEEGGRAPDGGSPTRTRAHAVRRWWYVLLLLPFVGTLVPPFYARLEPSVGGWPFFYWWQFAWIVVTALLLAFVYHVTTERVPVQQDRLAARRRGRHRDRGADPEGRR